MHDLSTGHAAQVAGPRTASAHRSAAMLQELADLTGHDGAWLTVSDTRLGAQALVASVGLGRSATEILDQDGTTPALTAVWPAGLATAVEVTTLPEGLVDRTLWRSCLVPAGFTSGLVAALRDGSGHQVAVVGLVSRRRPAPSDVTRHHLGRLAPSITRATSPMESLLAAARLVPEARAGVALVHGGSTCTLPGLQDHPLLRPGTPVIRVAGGGLAVGEIARSFLWPTSDSQVDGAHARLTLLATADVSRFVGGLLLLTPDADCRTLTPRELQVLGLLVGGRSNQQIASRLAVAPRTVATHVEHVMRKLRASSRTLAAVLAEREGLYVPSVPTAHRPR